MNNIDYRKAMFVTVICLICLVFIFIVNNAYKYIPENNNDTEIESVEVVETEQENYIDNEAENKDIQEEKDLGLKNDDRYNQKEKLVNKLEVLDYDETSGNIKEDNTENFESLKEQALILKKERKYAQALSTFHKILLLPISNEDKADCYEEIAYLYAIVNKFDEALIFAKKSNSIAPSLEKETLIARLYYKSGDIDRATNLVNEILRKEFSVD